MNPQNETSPDIPLPARPTTAVVGTGALGMYYGAKLAQSGVPVTFLARRDLAHLQKHGLQIRCPYGDFHLHPARACGTPAEIGPVDLVLVCIKTTANADLQKLIPPLLGPQTVLCTLQNGLGNEELLASIAGKERILGGVCHVCVSRPEPGVARNLACTDIKFSDLSGGDTPRARSLAKIFADAGVNCTVAPSIDSARWYKLVWNVPFNGLGIAGGSGGRDTQQVLEDPALHQQAKDLMTEVLAASAKLGYPQDPNLIEKEIARTRTMGHYKSSSQLDWEAGKPVELESIWGEALRQGTAAGIPMPHLQKLYEKLKGMVKV
jgi:2-dehydropantoate 2-reductase